MIPYTKILRRDEEISDYMAGYKKTSKYPLDRDSIKNAHVRAFYFKGKMIGGYILNSGPELRYFELIPAELKKSNAFLARKDLHNSIEICSYWMDKKFKKFARLPLYTFMLIDVISSGKDIIVGGSTVPKIKDLHMSAGLNNIIYSGNTKFGKVDEHVWLYFGDKSSFRKKIKRTLFLKTLGLYKNTERPVSGSHSLKKQ